MAGLHGGPLCRQGQTANTFFSLILIKIGVKTSSDSALPYIHFVKVSRIKLIYFQCLILRSDFS